MQKFYFIILLAAALNLYPQDKGIGITPDILNQPNLFTAYQQLLRDIDTAAFNAGGGTTASITQTGQVNKVLCTGLNVGTLTKATLTVNNSLIAVTSIILVTIEYTTATDLTANGLIWGCDIRSAGQADIIFTPTIALSSQTNDIWIHYTIF